MKYIIIEDEIIASEHLHELLQRQDSRNECVGIWHSVEESVQKLPTSKADILFMDIKLGDGDCFDIIQSTSTTIPIIFTTAFNSYALKAFQANGIDYLLKPIEEKDVVRALEKIDCLCKHFSPNIYQQLSAQLAAPRKRLLIEKHHRYAFINISEVAFFMVEERYVMAYLMDGKIEITELQNMDELLLSIAGNDFFQLSRNAVVSIHAIQQVERIENQRLLVTLQAGAHHNTQVVVSARRRKEFLTWLGK